MTSLTPPSPAGEPTTRRMVGGDTCGNCGGLWFPPEMMPAFVKPDGLCYCFEKATPVTAKDGLGFCNKCGWFGTASTREQATQRHRAEAIRCDYSPSSFHESPATAETRLAFLRERVGELAGQLASRSPEPVPTTPAPRTAAEMWSHQQVNKWSWGPQPDGNVEFGSLAHHVAIALKAAYDHGVNFGARGDLEDSHEFAERAREEAYAMIRAASSAPSDATVLDAKRWRYLRQFMKVERWDLSKWATLNVFTHKIPGIPNPAATFEEIVDAALSAQETP